MVETAEGLSDTNKLGCLILPLLPHESPDTDAQILVHGPRPSPGQAAGRCGTRWGARTLKGSIGRWGVLTAQVTTIVCYDASIISLRILFIPQRRPSG